MRVRVGSGPLWDASLVPLSFFPRFPFGIRRTSDFPCFVDFLHGVGWDGVFDHKSHFFGWAIRLFWAMWREPGGTGEFYNLGPGVAATTTGGGWVVFLGTASALPFHLFTDGREMSKASQPASEEQSQFFLSSPSFTIKPSGVSIKISCG